MQRMIMIPVEQYDRMLESYDETVNELMALKDLLCGNKSSTRQWVDQLLERLDERQLRILCFFIKGMTGDVI